MKWTFRLFFLFLLLFFLTGCFVSSTRTSTSSPTLVPVRFATPTLQPLKLDDTPQIAPTPIPPIRFAVIGDYGENNRAEQAVAALVTSWQPDLIITTGDNNYPDGSAETIDQNIGQYYHSYIYPYHGAYGEGSLVNRFYPSLGNHDWGVDQVNPYLEYFTLPGNERYYKFVQGPVSFFALDSDANEIDGVTSDSTQGIWLEQQLAQSTSPWNIVYFHHPPYSSGIHGSIDWMQWPFKEWGVDLVLSGHDHDYERLQVNDLTYIVNGLGGANIYDFLLPRMGSIIRYDKDHGAMLFECDATHLHLQFITLSGTTIDETTLSSNPLD